MTSASPWYTVLGIPRYTTARPPPPATLLLYPPHRRTARFRDSKVWPWDGFQGWRLFTTLRGPAWAALKHVLTLTIWTSPANRASTAKRDRGVSLAIGRSSSGSWVGPSRQINHLVPLPAAGFTKR